MSEKNTTADSDEKLIKKLQEETSAASTVPGAFSMGGFVSTEEEEASDADASNQEQEPDPEVPNDKTTPEPIQASLVVEDEDDDNVSKIIVNAKPVPLRNKRRLFIYGLISGLVIIVAATVAGVMLSESSGASSDSGEIPVYSHHLVVTARKPHDFLLDYCDISQLPTSEVNIDCGEADLLLFHQDNMECSSISEREVTCREFSSEGFALVGITCAGIDPAGVSVSLSTPKVVCNTRAENDPLETQMEVVTAFATAEFCDGTFVARSSCESQQMMIGDLNFCVDAAPMCQSNNCEMSIQQVGQDTRTAQCSVSERSTPSIDFESQVASIIEWIETA